MEHRVKDRKNEKSLSALEDKSRQLNIQAMGDPQWRREGVKKEYCFLNDEYYKSIDPRHSNLNTKHKETT